MSGAVAKPDAHTSGDPIGTAQERELIERGRTDAAEIEACGAGNEAATMRQLADALQSRIAEVGRLEKLVAQARVDILTTLGAVRDQMPSEAVAIFQRIAKDFLHYPPHTGQGDNGERL